MAFSICCAKAFRPAMPTPCIVVMVVHFRAVNVNRVDFPKKEIGKSQSTRNLKLFFTLRGFPSKLKNQITRDDISTFFPSQFTRGPE